MGSGDWRFSLPITAQNADGVVMPASLLDNGASYYQGTVSGTIAGLTDRVAIFCPGIASVNTSVSVSASTPFTWGSTDALMFNGSYEAA